MIDIDDDINSDDIWVKFNEIWVIFGWYLGDIWVKFGWNLMIYTCVVICVGVYPWGYSDSYILMIFGMKLMKFGWYLGDIWVIFGWNLGWNWWYN